MAGNNIQQRVLCLRFSALGDAVIAAVVIQRVPQPPRYTLYLRTALTAPLFHGLQNVSFAHRYNGTVATIHSALKTNPTHVADLHSVLRTFC